MVLTGIRLCPCVSSGLFDALRWLSETTAGVFTMSPSIPETVMWLLVAPWRTAGPAGSVFTGSASWEGEVSNGNHSNDSAHIKDLKNILEVRPPADDRLFISPRMEMPTDHVPFTPLAELPLNIPYGPAIESITMSDSRCVSLVQLTPVADLLHRTRTDRARPVAFHSSPGQVLDRYRRKITQARRDPVHSPLDPCYV